MTEVLQIQTVMESTVNRKVKMPQQKGQNTNESTVEASASSQTEVESQ